MTDIVERLHVVRDHLRTGRFGQREVWEEWLTEAAEAIERLREHVKKREDYYAGLLAANEAEIERLRAALQKIADDATPGDDNYCSEMARRALEPKP